MSKASEASVVMELAADLIELAEGYLDGASMDVMALSDEKLGYSFMGSLTMAQAHLRTVAEQLRGIARDVDRHERGEVVPS